ncbi:hypothetical protein GWK47_006504 [Chionoecetes opilio]|uniref:Uncharacterized protein n=1 Tax=Chionoecetes opilio TaxID=41210 RepID=A0A8J4YE42_CHIOP|nr:hypothetical protein GWK47_006504 [Chionoecetes opilio]
MTLRDVNAGRDPHGGSVWDMARIPMIRKDNIVTKFGEAPSGVRAPKERSLPGNRGLKSRKKRILRYFRQNLFEWHTECADHDDQPGGQRVPPRPTGARTSRKGMGGVDSVLAAQETRQSFRLKKRPLLSSARKQERLPLPHLGKLESSPSSSSNTSAVVSDEEYGAVGGASPAKRAKTGHEEHRLSALAATWIEPS